MRPHVLFVDPLCPRPYCDGSLCASAMGGTESTVIRIAEGLARTFDVTVAQHCRREDYASASGVLYVPLRLKERARGRPADTVVVVRGHKLLRPLRKMHPDAELYLWMHCYPGNRQKRLADLLIETHATAITVSDHHRDVVRAFMRRQSAWRADLAPVIRIHNPVRDDLVPDGTEPDANKLVFLSSPHKGLEQVLDNFRVARTRIPSLRLFVANPGYIVRPINVEVDGVFVLGPLPQHEALRHVRESLCLFYPQSQFAETFGLVFAESNAVGTPVMAHRIGAAGEILADERQFVDADDPADICSRLEAWRNGNRPSVFMRQDFRLERVLQQWRELIQRSVAPRRSTPFLSRFGQTKGIVGPRGGWSHRTAATARERASL